MNRVRPTITIDFEEYKELQDYKETFKKSSIADYTEVIKTFARYVSNTSVQSIQEELKDKGLQVNFFESEGFTNDIKVTKFNK